MNKKDEIQSKVMEINWEQQKALANPLRSRIVALLFEKAMTPKQVADEVGKNPGTVYYHMQQLYKHDLLEIERVDTEKGIVEKYYKAKANVYRNPDEVNPPGHVAGGSTRIYMSDELLEEFRKSLQDLFFKYGRLAHQEKDRKEQSPYAIDFQIKESNEEDQ